MLPARRRLTVVRGQRARLTDEITPARADHRPAERMRAEDRLGEEVVDEILRRVLDHRDLLEHDLALRVELGERRREDHVGHHVEGSSRDAVVGTRA